MLRAAADKVGLENFPPNPLHFASVGSRGDGRVLPQRRKRGPFPPPKSGTGSPRRGSPAPVAHPAEAGHDLGAGLAPFGHPCPHPFPTPLFTRRRSPRRPKEGRSLLLHPTSRADGARALVLRSRYLLRQRRSPTPPNAIRASVAGSGAPTTRLSIEAQLPLSISDMLVIGVSETKPVNAG